MKNATKKTGGRSWWIVVLCGFAFAFPGVALAQRAAGTSSQLDAALNYSYVRSSSPGSGFDGNLQGASASIAYKFHWHWGVVADFGGYEFNGDSSGLTTRLYTYMVGPRYTLGKSNRFSPFAQALVGGGRLSASLGSIHASENGFALAVGGGLDVGVGHHLAIRLVQGEYLMTRFSHVNTTPVNQNCVRISAGLVFRLGVR